VRDRDPAQSQEVAGVSNDRNSGRGIRYHVTFENDGSVDEKLLPSSFRQQLLSNLDAAISNWGLYFDSKSATLEIGLEYISNSEAGRFFGGGLLLTGMPIAVDEYKNSICEYAATRKLRTGKEIPPAAYPASFPKGYPTCTSLSGQKSPCDIWIGVNVPYLVANYWIDPAPNVWNTPMFERSAKSNGMPKDRLDLIMPLAHELIHSFGVNGKFDNSWIRPSKQLKALSFPSNSVISVYDKMVMSASRILNNKPMLTFDGFRTRKLLGGILPITYFSIDHRETDVIRIGRASKLTGSPKTLWYDFKVFNYISQNVYHYGRFGGDVSEVLDDEPNASFYGLGAGVWVHPPLGGDLLPVVQPPHGLVHVTELDGAIILDLIEYANQHSREPR
jgi:hypothetical protein